jgi:high-affinity Fe2+/Pb2+ permease
VISDGQQTVSQQRSKTMDPMILACLGVVTAMVIGFVIVRGKRA